MSTINERITQLRTEMKQRGIDVYIVPTSDYHTSEYVGEYFKERAFITGFTGSAGTAVITANEAGLWTDGRYFIQAAHQIADSEVVLFPMGEEGVPTVEEYVKDKLIAGGNIGYDGRCITMASARKYQKIAKDAGGKVFMDEDLIARIWTNRPQLPAEKIWILDEAYAGENTSSKIERIREKMREKNCDVHFINSLYDIAWILNLRGNDIPNVPVFLSFLWISQKEITLYVQEEALSDEVREYLDQISITIRPYDAVYKETQAVNEMNIWLDEDGVSELLYCNLPKTGTIVFDKNPSELMRAVKNNTEIENSKKAHIKDGVAFTRFMYYVKKHVTDGNLTEVSAADYLEERRREQEHFIDLSFDTICAYGSNAAMMHYSATPEKYSELKPEGLLLVDSGGHYLEGTTDITRTIALGELTQQMIDYFTVVLRCNLRLASAKFPVGCCGQNLDVLARGPVWEMGLDYRCGTGHGVGHILNVHEGPNAFRWRIPVNGNVAPLEPGMITTDEPGLYIEDAFGIRTENELLCVEAEKTEYGQFLQFEPLTFAPIDLDAVDVSQLDMREIKQLNEYHAAVYEKISPYLPEEERVWLKEITREV